jgi:hypothetical protein
LDDDGSQRGLFAGLAGLAALALVGAVVAWLLAVPNAGVWIIACLVVLVIVIGVEVTLLVLARQKQEPSYRTPEPHKGPGADDEIMDFVIEADDTEGANGAR